MPKGNIIRRTAIVIYVLLSVLYVVWRIGFTLNPEQMTTSVIFVVVDVFMCISAVWFFVSLWQRPADSTPPCTRSQTYSIDVLVPTYNESREMLKVTLQHCIDMDCPHETYLLDDGNRAEMKSLAEELGVEYITREKNKGAKAGNLNNAMQYTRGELVAIFDADFRPEREFLSRLSGYFDDEKIAVVQVPQSYYNTDSFQHWRLSKNEVYSDQDTFMHLVLPARNNWNAAYWIGTNTLMRREAIESIGGFPTDCVTEDVLTSMLIHGKGWRSVYVDEPLAYGLAPANISEYFTQRLRWAKGAFQILRSHNPLFKKGLSLMQRFFYLSSVCHFLEGIVKIVYYLFPAFFFLFGLIPIYPYPPIVIGMLMYVGITSLTLTFILGKHTDFIMDEIYSIIRSFIYLMALPAFITGKNIRFKVTPKDGRISIAWQGVIGPAIILGFNLVAMLTYVLNPVMMKSMGIFGWIVFGWCFYMASLALFACLHCFKPLIKRSR